MKKTRLLMAIICCMSFMALVANLTACVAEKPAPQPVATVLKSRIPAFEVSAPTAGAEIADSNFGINFKFELGGVLEPLTSYSGGGVTFEMKEATEGNNPTNTPTNLNSFIVGVEWENFIIERNYSNDKKNWREWWAKIKNGDVEYKNFTLTYLDKKGNPTGRSLKGFNAFPIRYDVINFDSQSHPAVLRETMELVVAHYEYEGDTNGGYVPNTAPLTEPETKGNPNLKPAELTLITGFALYFVDSQGNRTPTGSWQSISGGEECVEVVETTTGENQHEQKRPGQAYFTDITLKGPLSKDRKAVMDWINDTAKGKAQARNLVLVFLNDKGEGQRTWNLLDTYPVSYTPGDYSPSSKENVETIKAKPGMIEMAD